MGAIGQGGRQASESWQGTLVVDDNQWSPEWAQMAAGDINTSIPSMYAKYPPPPTVNFFSPSRNAQIPIYLQHTFLGIYIILH
jgi:hypothetical protein